MTNNEEITNKELAERIDSVNTDLAKRIDSVGTELKNFKQETTDFHKEMRDFRTETRSAINELREGMFTPDEKEALLSIVKHIDQRLENDALGKGDITLARAEYDGTALAAGFVNRFEHPTEVTVD